MKGTKTAGRNRHRSFHADGKAIGGKPATRKITRVGIPVIGLTPQSSYALGRFKFQEKTKEEGDPLIADDNTRLTPTDTLIPILLDECNAAGIPDSAIHVIIALGTYRFMTDDEIREKFGGETLRRVPVVNHPCRDPDAHIDLGMTANGVGF